jgi:hypothetical protein
MKISEPSWSPISKNNNQLALDNPQVGDYWNERFCPYFLVVAVRDDKITVLSCLGGEHSFNRKHEQNARIMNTDDMTWSFDYSKHMVVNREWMAKAVKYSSIDGFCADVVREGMSGVVEEWKQFHRERLTKELEEMGV